MNLDITNRSTWPEVLTVQDVAAIWRLSVYTVNRMVCKGLFVPAPNEGHPRRWRKDDVVRWLERRTPAVDSRRGAFSRAS